MSSKQDGLNGSKVNPGARKQIKNSIRPALEQLETRMVPAKVVTTILDTTNPSSPTTGSLRAAITLPSPSDRTIEFNEYLFAASVGTTHNPTALALGDFRGTGKTDVISASAFINSYTFAPDNGNGVGILNQASTVNTTTTGASSNITAIEAANLNGDSFQDFVTIQSDGIVYAYKGSAAGTFTAGGTVTLGGTGAGLIVGDLNNDGKTDVAAALTGTTGKVVVAYGNGDGTFGSPTTITPGNGNFVSLAYGDVTGDGDKYQDLVALSSDGKLTTLLGAASSPFSTFKSTTVTGTSTTLSSLTIGDLNTDGKADAIIVNRTAGTITTMLGSATGGFTTGSVTTLTSGALPGVARLSDFNGDTKVDLAVTQYGLDNVAIYTGKNDGSFNTTAATFDVVDPTDIRVADMTGDGKLDIVASSETSQSFAVFANSGTGTFNPVAYRQATFVLNGAVGALNDTLTNDIKITAANSTSSLFPANTYDAQGNSLANKPRVILQADVGFDQRDYDLTNTAQFPAGTTTRGSGFRVNDILTQGITSTQGGARFQVLGVDAAGGITNIRVLQPGSQTVYDPYSVTNTKISPPSTLSQTGVSPYFKLTVLSGNGSGLAFATTSFSLNKRTGGLFFQNTPNKTLSLDGIAFNAAADNAIIVTQGNLTVTNSTFSDIDTLYSTARGNLYFIRLQAGAGNLTIGNTRFDDGRVDAINGNTGGNITITGSSFANMDGQALTIGANSVTIDSCVFNNNGDRTSGPATNTYYTLNSAGNLLMSPVGTISGSNKITINNSIFDNNSEDNGGPLSEQRSLKLTGGTVTVTNSVFRNNVLNGALEITGTQATVTNSWFDGNSARMYFATTGSGDQLRGGSALLIRDGTPLTLTANKFTNNLADNINSRFSGGGAVYLSSGTVTIDQCAFEGNMAKITGYFPGSEGTDYISNPELNPSPRYSGGGALYAGGATTIRDSYFTNNSVQSYIDIWQLSANEAVTLSRPEFSGGGAILLTRNTDSAIQSNIFNTTFVDNIAQQAKAIKDINRSGLQRLDQTVASNTTTTTTTNTANVLIGTPSTTFSALFPTPTVSPIANNESTGVIFVNGVGVQSFRWGRDGGTLLLDSGPASSGTINTTTGVISLNWSGTAAQVGAVKVSIYYQTTTDAYTPLSTATGSVTTNDSNSDIISGGIGGLSIITGGGNASTGYPTVLSSGDVGQVLVSNLDNAGTNEIVYLQSTGSTSTISTISNLNVGVYRDSAGSVTYSDPSPANTSTSSVFTGQIASETSAAARTMTYQLANIPISRIISSTISGGRLTISASNVQSFTVMANGDMTFTKIGSPANYALSGTMNFNNGTFSIVWNSVPATGTTSITNLNYSISSIIEFKMGDFDADSFQDIAYINTTGNVDVKENYYSAGNVNTTSFGPKQTITPTGTPVSLGFAQFDGAGADIAVLTNNAGSYSVSTYVYNTDSAVLAFTKNSSTVSNSGPLTLTGSGWTKLVTGDFITSGTSGGIQDIAVYNPTSKRITMGSTSFNSTSGIYFPLSGQSTITNIDTTINAYISSTLYTDGNTTVDTLGAFSSGDMNGDNIPDFVISVKLKSSDPTRPTDAIAILTSNGGGGISGTKVYLVKPNETATLDRTIINESTNKETGATPSSYFASQTFTSPSSFYPATAFPSSERAGTVYRDNTPIQNFFVDSLGNYTFEKIGLPNVFVSSATTIGGVPTFTWTSSDTNTIGTTPGSNHISIRAAERVSFTNSAQISTPFPAFSTTTLNSGGLSGFVYVGGIAVQGFTVGSTGTLSFNQITNSFVFAASGTLDFTTGQLNLVWNRSNSLLVQATLTYVGAPTNTYYNALTNYATTGGMSGTIYAGNTAVQTFTTGNIASENTNTNPGTTSSVTFNALLHPVANTATPITKGTLYIGGVAVQTFTYTQATSTFTFTDIGTPTFKGVPSGSTFNVVTGVLTLAFNNAPNATVYANITYQTSDQIFTLVKIGSPSVYVTDMRLDAISKTLALSWNANPSYSRVETTYKPADYRINTQPSLTNNSTFAAVSSSPIGKGTLSGTVYLAGVAIQTFTVDNSNTFIFTDIGTPSLKASNGTIDLDTGLLNLFWNGTLTGSASVIVSYNQAYNSVALATGKYNSDSRLDIVAANSSQSVSVYFGDGTGGLPNVPSTGRGLNGGAILISEGRQIGTAVTQAEAVRSGSLDVRVYNTTIVANSLINTFAANDDKFPTRVSTYDPTRGTRFSRSPNSNYTAVAQTNGNSNYGNYADVGGLFNDTFSGSKIRLLNTIPINNTGIDYGYASGSGGTANITQTDLSSRPIVYSSGSFYSEGSVLIRPLASILFNSGTVGDIIQSDQQVNFDTQELIDSDYFRGSLVGPVLSNIGSIQTQLSETDTQKIRYLPLSRLSPARDGGASTVGGVSVVGLLNSSGTDIRGANRAVNNAIDMGAYEVQIASRTDLFDSSILTPGNPNPTITTPFEYGQPINIDLKTAWNDNVIPTAAVTGTVSLVRVSDDVTLGTADYGTPVNSADISTGKHSVITINPGTSTYSTLLAIGTSSVYGSYAGDQNYAASQTNPFNIVITKASTVVSIDPTTAVESGTSVTISGKVTTPQSVATLAGEGSVKVEYQVPGSSIWVTLTSAATLTLDPTDSSTANYTVSTGLFTGLGQYNLRATFLAGGPNHYTNSAQTIATQDIVKTPTVAIEFRNQANTALLTAPATVTHNTAFVIRAIVTAGVSNPTPIGTIDLVKSDNTLLSVGNPVVSSGGSGIYFYDFAIASNTPGLVLPAFPGNSLLARYNGYGTVAGDYFKTVSSTAQNLIINGIKATLSLSSTSPSTVLYGTKINVDAQLGNNGNPGVAFDTTGTIKLVDTTLFTQVGSFTNSVAGLDTISTSFPLLPVVGKHDYDATYTGDGFNYDPLTTTNPLGLISFTVSKAPVSSSTLSAPIYAAQSSLVHLAVNLSNGAAGADASALKPTGTVTFYATSGSNRIALGTTTLVAGAGTFDYTTTAGGQYPISIVYSGDSNYDGTASGTYTPFGTLIVPTITLNLGGNPANASRGANVSFTATISPAGSALEQPSDVTFNFVKNNNVVKSVNVPLNSSNPGLYTLSTQLGGATLDLANGAYTVTATYSQGSGLYPTMVSAARTLNVGLSSSTTTLATTTTSGLYRYGENVALAATITGTSGLNFLAPGTVDIIDGSKALNTAALPLTGSSPQTVTVNSANLATALSVGSHNLQAKYSGDSANYSASSSPTTTLNIIKADTTATVSAITPASGIVISGGQLVLQVTIGTPTYVSANATRPTGTVTFVSAGTTLGTATVNSSGVATLTINPTALGNFSVTATYGGDGNYNSSNINTSYTVASLNFTTFASSVIQRGSLLSLSAAVGPNTDTRANTPLGSVNFVIPGTPDTLITSVALAQAVNGVYSTTIDTGNPAFNLPVGNYNIVAKYLPGATDAYPAITSNLQTLTVTQQATTTALATTPAAPAAVPYGTSVNINATVAPTINGGFPIPFTGSSTVNILDGTTIIRNLTVTDAARSPAFDSKNLATALSVGSHNIQAKYLGDGANYSSSASSIKTITVNKADTSIAVSGITPVTAIVTSGGALSFQVTISTPSYVEANATRPTGTVTFVSVNTTPGSVPTTLGTATVNSSGVATLTINPTALGNFSVTATYGGDGNYNSSNINTSYTVASLNFTTLASSVIQRGSLLSLSAAVAPNTDTRANTPLGSVNFVIPGTPDTLITSVALAQAVNGVYSTTIDTGNPAFNLPVGNYNIVAKYLPGATDAYPAITSNLQTLTVTQQATTTALATTPAVTTSVPYGTSITVSATASSTINGGFAMPFTGASAMRILDGSTLLTTLNVSDSASGKSPSTASSSFATSSLSTALSVGSHILQAKYQGDGVNYAASSSTTQSINIVQASTSMLTSDLLITPSRTVAAGTNVTITVKVTPDASVAANAIKPTGTVTFVATPSGGSTTTLGSGIVDPITGFATITVSTQAVGNFAVVATYSGNGNYTGSVLNTSYTVAALNFAPLASNVIQRGSQLTLTADVTPSADSRLNTPLGYVNFVIPGTSADTLIASVNLSSSVNGRYSTTIDTGNPAFNLPVGTYKIVAKYVAGASDAYPAIVSGEQSLVVTKQSITLGGSLDRTSLVYGGAVSLTNSFITPGIAGSTIAFDANAFVTLFDGQTSVATIPFTDSFRTLVLPPITFNAGVHNLQLRFAGDTNYQAGTFDLPVLTVSQAPANIALISSGFNQAAGKAFTLTAQVSTPQLNLPTIPSGTVTFSIDNAVVGQSSINANGQAILNFTPTAAGAYVVKASYSGDNNFGPPVSTTTTVVASTLTLSPIVPSIATLGGKITLSAISAPASDNVLFSQNGTVDFVLPNGIVVATATADNSTVTANGRLYTLNIDSGIAQYNLRAGTVTIRAVYRPGTNDPYPTLTSTAQSVQLNSQPTETVLVADPLASAPFGSPISITISTQSVVGSGNVSTTIPFGNSGTISLFDGSTLLQKSAVSGSTLSTTFTIPVLNGGAHNLNAVYSGDSVNFLGSKSNVVTLQIAKAETSVTLTPSNGSALVGVPVTLTATLASTVSSTFGLPTGSVQFKLGTTVLATVPVTGTTAKFAYTPSKPGMGAFTATYLGNTNFAVSSANASLQFRARDPIFIVASQAGSTFMTYNAKTGKQISIFQPLGPTYTGGFRVAKGDVNGDGYADFAYTTNTGSFVRVIDGRTQSSLGGFYAYTSTYNKPVNLAIGDINGDGKGDIIVGPGGSGYGPNVKAFSGANYATVLFNKNVYSTSFVSGVSVASADVNGDGKSDIICAPMAGAGPNVVVYSGATGNLLNSINAIATGNISGFSVTADDLTGDGKAEIILAAMSGTQQVIVLDGATLQPRNSFLPFGTTFTGGSRVTTVEDIDGDGIRDIVVASGPGGNSEVRRFSGQDTRAIDSFFAYAATNAARNKGLFIA